MAILLRAAAPIATLSTNGRFIKAPIATLSRPASYDGRGRDNPQIWPSEARSAVAPHKQFINGWLATVLIEAGPDGQFIKAA